MAVDNLVPTLRNGNGGVVQRLAEAFDYDERLHEQLRGLLSRKTTGGPERCLRRGEKIAKLIGQIKLNEVGIAWLYYRLAQLNGRLAA